MQKDMAGRSLEVTYRDGKPVAAYLYLPRQSGDRPIGIEITAPQVLSLEALNRALASLDQEPATEQELGPLAAA